MENDTMPAPSLSAPPRRRGFFTRIDWASFWTATAASFLVYFLTVAPSVTLEDAGELVTAGDHLGVPHPPGYPIWTVCAFLFARALSFVRYLGQPNPAWAIALMSGFFAAIAAGMTAMLITRTSADMLDEFDRTGDDAADRARHALLSWTGGVAGSLVFAFSPVEWSQATIPEVYTLNALFLMWVFLLSYRWMRRPSDKVLWATAFLFGLGITNYQVLVFAIVPLVIIILLRDIALFRDFALATLPILLTAGILMLGAEISRPGFAKCPPFPGFEEFLGPPLANPILYAAVLVLLVAAAGIALAVGILRRRGTLDKDTALYCAVALAAVGLVAVAVCAVFPTAREFDLTRIPPEEIFRWGKPVAVFLALLAATWALAWFAPGGRWYAGAVTIVELSLAILLKKGCLLGLTHPQTGWFLFYVALNFVFLALAWVLLPRGRSIAVAFLCAEAGAAFYGYMPIASDTHPPMNWGYPRTWTGFKHAISRGQYEKIVPTNPFAPIVVEQLGSYFTDLRKQFTLLLAPLGFLPFALWSLRPAPAPVAPDADKEIPAVGASPAPDRAAMRGFRCFPLAFLLVCAVAALAAIDRLWNKADAFVPHQAFTGILGVVLLCAGIGFAVVVLRTLQGLLRAVLDPGRPLSDRVTSGFCLAGASVVLLVAVIGMSHAVCAFHFVGSSPSPAAIEAARPQIFAATAALAAVVLAALAGIAVLACRRGSPIGLAIDDTAQQWLLSTFACFLVMSFLLIVMAAPKGDLQDNFIQKVKFISSHAIFSLWIGYGIAFGIATAARLLRSSPGASPRLVRAAVLAASLLVLVGAPLVPIYENYFNDELVDATSSADQYGHDFGWQFGNYQLRGAEAIAEELSADEEPLPNPDFPPAMTTNAVFYGGTDPGRFVPTYMIFSADVRPDVFLITQNALADNTYMDTMRDMYGDQIWMPTQKDNASAFSEYVEDVRAGRRPNFGDISYEGGRVQVTGALAVMEINGILTEQIFRQNRDRHDFYVEESYAMRWMYPYETPHGLIMKVEHDRTPLSPKHVRDDLDFWDWYSRRLLGTPAYPRDFAARKSFSKLRSSIAGLYSARGPGFEAAAERAFREAVRLYPASPESNIRLVQEILMPRRRFAEALRLLNELRGRDPNNKRMPEIIAQIEAAERARLLVEQFGDDDPAALDTGTALGLASAQISIQRQDRAQRTLRALLGRLDTLSPEDAFDLGRLCSSAQMPQEAARAFAAVPPDRADALADSPAMLQSVIAVLLNGGRSVEAENVIIHHLRADKDDWRCWMELALIRRQRGRPKDAAIALDRARKIVIANPGQAEAFLQMLQDNATLAALYRQVYQPAAGTGYEDQ